MSINCVFHCCISDYRTSRLLNDAFDREFRTNQLVTEGYLKLKLIEPPWIRPYFPGNSVPQFLFIKIQIVPKQIFDLFQGFL